MLRDLHSKDSINQELQVEDIKIPLYLHPQQGHQPTKVQVSNRIRAIADIYTVMVMVSLRSRTLIYTLQTPMVTMKLIR